MVSHSRRGKSDGPSSLGHKRVDKLIKSTNLRAIERELERFQESTAAGDSSLAIESEGDIPPDSKSTTFCEDVGNADAFCAKPSFSDYAHLADLLEGPLRAVLVGDLGPNEEQFEAAMKAYNDDLERRYARHLLEQMGDGVEELGGAMRNTRRHSKNDRVEKMLISDEEFTQQKRELEEQLASVLDGTHEELVAAGELADMRHKHILDAIDLSAKLQRERLDHMHQRELDALNKELRERTDEVLTNMLNDVDENIKQLDSDVNSLDVGQPAPSTSSTFGSSTAGGKKALRRRGLDDSCGQLSGAAQGQPFMSPSHGGGQTPTYGATTPSHQSTYHHGQPPHPAPVSAPLHLERRRKVHFKMLSGPSVSWLLSEQQMADDLRLFCGENALSPRGNELAQQYRVVIEPNKFTYENKTYNRGQNVMINTRAYGQFATIITLCGDGVVQFRSTTPGDIRVVNATADDLESGRVTVRKRII